jgi:hypothetical protein
VTRDAVAMTDPAVACSKVLTKVAANGTSSRDGAKKLVPTSTHAAAHLN